MHQIARPIVIGTVLLGALLVVSGLYIFSSYQRGAVQSDSAVETSKMPTQIPCVRSGCSGQLCVDAKQSDGMVTTCEWKEEYVCYESAVCEIQDDGSCGWTLTPELIACVGKNTN